MQSVTKLFMQRKKVLWQQPTAGLHFSKHLLKKVRNQGIKFAEVTLHVGLERSIQLR
jgi:S-adenosylmethionine:tRNA-ribosyltransferase-isomerase (queuine synthetase)